MEMGVLTIGAGGLLIKAFKSNIGVSGENVSEGNWGRIVAKSSALKRGGLPESGQREAA